MRAPALLFGVLFLAGAASAQDPTYVGDDNCSGCHPTKYDTYMRSGHPWKIYRTQGMVPAPDTWPFTPPPPLPEAFGIQLEWPDVEYTIGNYFWKTRFIDRDGFIWTGDADDTTQFNIATQGFVPYHPDEIRPFNCGRCHTTGYDPVGNQHGLPGLIGTWAQDGVRCEACHGPASDHVDSFGGTPPPGGKDCADCHYRDDDFRMPWKGGFMRHHQQAEDLSHSPHEELGCNTCHEPHKSVVYNEGGTIAECSQCHEGEVSNGFYEVKNMAFLECTDCHMPFMGKSAVAFNEFTGDIRGHLFRILPEPIAAIDNTYEVNGSRFWNQDDQGQSAATVDYACLGCHTDFDALTLEGAADFAYNIHEFHPANQVEVALDIKPGGCPNPLNRVSNGVLPVAILGSADFDVTQIDTSTLLLEGMVAPLRYNVYDVAAPATGDPCDCSMEGPDGYDDLTLKFKTQQLIAVLGTLYAGQTVEVSIYGNLLDGTPIGGTDCMIVVGNAGGGDMAAGTALGGKTPAPKQQVTIGLDFSAPPAGEPVRPADPGKR